MNTGYIYGLLCPIKERIVYVGQSTIEPHKKLALVKTHVKGDYGKWISELKETDLIEFLRIVIIQDSIPVENLTALETYWINEYSNRGDLINKNMTPRQPKRVGSNVALMYRYFVIDREIMKGNVKLTDIAKALCMVSPGGKISLRSVQSDIETMRKSSQLGFYAPIVYSKKDKVYSYSDNGYSILRVIEGTIYNQKQAA